MCQNPVLGHSRRGSILEQAEAKHATFSSRNAIKKQIVSGIRKSLSSFSIADDDSGVQQVPASRSERQKISPMATSMRKHSRKASVRPFWSCDEDRIISIPESSDVTLPQRRSRVLRSLTQTSFGDPMRLVRDRTSLPKIAKKSKSTASSRKRMQEVRTQNDFHVNIK